VGLRLLSLASVVGAALCGAGVARRLFDGRSARWAFWLTATSPVLADGLMVWAHAPAAALAGLGVLAGLALVRGERALWWPVLVLAVAVGVLLRSESVLFALSVGGVVGLAGLVARHGRAVAVGLVTGAATVAAFAGQRVWVHGITGASGLGRLAREGNDSYGWLDGRVHGAVVALVRGATSSATASVLAVLAAGLVAVAALAKRRPDQISIPPVGLLSVAAGLVVLRLLVAGDDAVSGLLVAWPAALLAPLALRRGRLAPLVVAAGLVVFTFAVVLTQYDDGGGLQWGGRYLAPLIVPLAALAAGGVVARLDSVGERRAVAALLAATAVLGLLVTDHVRRDNGNAVAQLASQHQPVGLAHGDGLARLDWAAWPARCWIADGDHLRGAVALLRRAGVHQAAYLDFAPVDFAGTAARATPDRPDARIGTLTVAGIGPLQRALDLPCR
jgi:hypothetical protein